MQELLRGESRIVQRKVARTRFASEHARDETDGFVGRSLSSDDRGQVRETGGFRDDQPMQRDGLRR
jgi:hypothetical protein